MHAGVRTNCYTALDPAPRKVSLITLRNSLRSMRPASAFRRSPGTGDFRRKAWLVLPGGSGLAQLSKEHAGLALLVDYDQLYLLSSGFSGANPSDLIFLPAVRTVNHAALFAEGHGLF